MNAKLELLEEVSLVPHHTHAYTCARLRTRTHTYRRDEFFVARGLKQVEARFVSRVSRASHQARSKELAARIEKMRIRAVLRDMDKARHPRIPQSRESLSTVPRPASIPLPPLLCSRTIFRPSRVKNIRKFAPWRRRRRAWPSRSRRSRGR